MSESEQKVEFEKFMVRESYRKSTSLKEGEEEILNKGLVLNKEKKCKFCTQGVTGTCSLNSMLCVNSKNRPYFAPSQLFQVLRAQGRA